MTELQKACLFLEAVLQPLKDKTDKHGMRVVPHPRTCPSFEFLLLDAEADRSIHQRSLSSPGAHKNEDRKSKGREDVAYLRLAQVMEMDLPAHLERGSQEYESWSNGPEGVYRPSLQPPLMWQDLNLTKPQVLKAALARVYHLKVLLSKHWLWVRESEVDPLFTMTHSPDTDDGEVRRTLNDIESVLLGAAHRQGINPILRDRNEALDIGPLNFPEGTIFRGGYLDYSVYT